MHGLRMPKMLRRCRDLSVKECLQKILLSTMLSIPFLIALSVMFPLPKEEEDQQTEMSSFHQFVHKSVDDGLQNATALRGTLLMLRSIVQVTPERIEAFGAPLMKLLGKLTKEHIQVQTATQGFESGVRLLMSMLEISHISVSCLGEQRKVPAGHAYPVNREVEERVPLPVCA
jgi:hypothetical protein